MKCIVRISIVSVLLLLVIFIILHRTSSINRQRTKNKYETKTPLIVHFIVGQVDQKNVTRYFDLATTLSMVNYLAILSARRHIHPKQLFVHYYEESNSFWWNMTKQDVELNVTLMRSRLIENIFGHPVYHHSHRSGILRTEILLKYGGIYLDIDVLVLRPFDDLLNLADVVVGYEHPWEQDIGSVVILAKTNAMLIRRVYDSYQSYNDSCWVFHATKIPGKLAAIYTKEVTVLPMRAFFLPYYSQRATFFEYSNYNFTLNYACHLWSKVFSKELRDLTPHIILNDKFNLARMLRHSIGNKTFHKLDKLVKTNSMYH